MGFSFSLSLLIPNQLITSVLNAFFINILLIFITTARKYTCLEDKNLHKISFHQIKHIFFFKSLFSSCPIQVCSYNSDTGYKVA